MVRQKVGRQNGGARRDRTADLYNAIVALSQLSYDPNITQPRYMDSVFGARVDCGSFCVDMCCKNLITGDAAAT